MGRTVLEFARAPVLGRVKRRLAATEGDPEALRIYRLLAEDVHAVLLEAQSHGDLDLVTCLADGREDGPEARTLSAWLPGARALWAQGEGDLGARMDRALGRALAQGASAAAVVGTDVVGLTPAWLEQAWAALATADVVLAPTPDGGYGFLALKRPAPALFRDIPWSTPQVAAATRAAARAAGFQLVELNGLRDVDTAADLEGVLPLVSVLVPVLDEMPRLAPRLQALVAAAAPHGRAVEIVVADGGSKDGSLEAARALSQRSPGLHTLATRAGRGTQLKAAAEAARGRWLWTLHADADVAPGTLERVLAHARRGSHPWAFSKTRIDAPGLFYGVVGVLTEIRARWLRLPYGDQGVLVKRSLYERVGGYADVPLMEDVLLAGQLSRFAAPACLGGRLTLDGRRWKRHGLARVALGNLRTLARFLVLGRPAQDLVRGYDRSLG